MAEAAAAASGAFALPPFFNYPPYFTCAGAGAPGQRMGP